MAEQDIVERLLDPSYRGPMQMLRSWEELDKLHKVVADKIDCLASENASLRQQLAEARETALNALLADHEALDGARHLMLWMDLHDRPTDRSLLNHCKRLGRQPPTECDDVDHVSPKALRTLWILREIVAAHSARALPHPDREGERLSETETAARIVDTQARYYAGHNEDIAKALKEAAGAIRAQSQPRPGREGERG